MSHCDAHVPLPAGMLLGVHSGMLLEAVASLGIACSVAGLTGGRTPSYALMIECPEVGTHT